MSALVLIVGLFACLLIGIPVAISLGLSSAVTMILFSEQTLQSLAQRLFHTMQVYPLLAVPFFILAGTFMTAGGAAQRMVAFANALVGHYRGGLAMASVLACAFFSAVSGSSPATVVAVGSIAIGGMVASGYSRPFAAGVICNAGTLGILIPPSIVLVIYGAVTETSVGALFMAGVVPGVALTLLMMLVIRVIAGRRDMPRLEPSDWLHVLRTGRAATMALLLIVLILGGIYGGIFTPTEAAAVAAVYAFIVAVFIHRDVTMAQTGGLVLDSAKLTAMLMFIIANAYVFAFVLTSEQIPQVASQAIIDLGLPPWAFLLLVNVLLLIAGQFIDPSSVILILAPLLFPIAMDLGIDPVHFGIMMVVNLEIGLVTPPVGLNLFVASGVANMSLEDIIKAAFPWLLMLVSFLVIVTYVPSISLGLPRWLGMVN
jgi:C4-dicarboxylate transporter, DctM subunit